MSTADELPALHPYAVSPGASVHIIIACIFTLLATICVVLRFVQRRRSREFWWDDWAILGSLIFAFGGVLLCTLLISAPSIGAAGYHINTYTVDQLNTYFKLMLAANVLYNPSIALSKASILFFYRRIFSVDGQFLMFMRIMGFFVIGNCLAAMLGLIFSSNPVEAQWNVGMPATTINGPAFWAVMAVVNIVLEMAMLAIAQIKVWKLQLSPRKKFLISGVLLLGAFTIIASILRIVYLLTVDVSDMTYTITTPGIWTNVEMNLSIICACLPMLYNLFRRTRGKGNTTARSTDWTPRHQGGVVTIGSGPSKLMAPFKSSQYLDCETALPNSHGYHAIVEADRGTEMHSMKSLDPVRVRMEYTVS